MTHAHRSQARIALPLERGAPFLRAGRQPQGMVIGTDPCFHSRHVRMATFEQEVGSVNRSRMFVNGEWVDAAGGEWTAVINPATEDVVAEVPRAQAEDGERALEAAAQAQRAWARLPAAARAAYILRAADYVRRESEHLARVIVAEQGKPIQQARGEVGFTAFLLSYAAEWARRIEGDILPADQAEETILIERVPHGVVLALTPWNYPSVVPARKIGLALVAGNTVVLKPHELTPLSALELARAFEQADLPSGVFNVVTGIGEEVGASMVQSPVVQYITMTGSVEAGRLIAAAAARNITPISLELGGKAPFIVLEDADLDLAVRHAVSSRFTNCGQVCTCNERTYVHTSVYDEFQARYLAAAQALAVGDPLDERTDMGPKVSKEELEKVDRMVSQARAAGASVILGGEPLRGGRYERGFWYPPTILTDLRQDMEIMQSEVFGPVSPLVRVGGFEEAVALANDSQYGLSAYLFTNDFRRIMRAVQDVDFGELYVNKSGPESFHAFHSGYRHSGIGGDDGRYGLEEYLRKKTVYLNYGG